MLKAALDFSGSELAFAVVDDSGATVASCLVDLPGRDSSTLPVLVGDALKKASLAYADLDSWTVGTGPGSFTALRVAAAFVLGVVQGTDKPVRGLPSACGFEGETPFGDRVLVLYDGRKRELLGFGLRREGRFWIPDGFQGVLETPDKLEAIRASYDTFTARPCYMDAVIAFAPGLPVVPSPHVNASVLAAIPSELCDMSPTDLIYLRPPVFVDPKPVRVFPEL
ncbi:MAG: tRNA (adenosine(37)-N6)-threonylcarbamoyltransferase complex dimerization subunit type 1 TsaB [Lentisphaeria bacterium]|nr:tRNA (adenosine(37)-N6)-threonylcarbamoyltransferase complex dimerization subunit type 1 TsaB [Lentisphaeria bacterium]